MFADSTINTCVVKCSGDYYGDELTRTCVKTCPIKYGYYAYPPNNRCYRKCIYPYFGLLSTGFCVQNCPSNQFSNLINNLCTACPSVCLTCMNTLLCTSCIVKNVTTPTTYYLYQGTCLSGCLTDLTNGSCVAGCPMDISTGQILYASNASQTCEAICPLGTYGFNITQYCISKCPINYYAANDTSRC